MITFSNHITKVMKQSGFFILHSSFFISLLLSAVSAKASENTIQVKPLFSPATVTQDENRYFSFEMRTDSVVQSMQMDVRMPLGVHISKVEWDSSNYSTNYNFDFNCINTTDNIYRIIGWSSKAEGSATGKNINVFNLFYEADGSLATGIHPVITNANILGMDTLVAIYPDMASSFLIVGNENETKGKDVSDYSSLSGYVPSFVCEQITGLLSKDLTVTNIDLQNIDSIGGNIKAGNANALYYATENTKTLQQLSTSLVNNVIYFDNSGNATAESILLAGNDSHFIDSEASTFNTTQEIQTSKFRLDRTLPLAQWATLCMPISATEQETEDIMSALDMKAYTLASYDATTNQLHFAEVSRFEANTPYLIRLNGSVTELPETYNTVITPTTTVNDVTVDDGVTFCGTFEQSIMESTTEMTYYGYDANDGTFRKVGKNVKLYPFRAYIKMPAAKATAPAKMAVSFIEDEDIATRINEIDTTPEDNDTWYNLSGQRVKRNAKGIIIKRGKKIVKQ